MALVLTACGHMAPYSEKRLDYVELYAGVEHRYQLRIPYTVTVYEPFPTRSYVGYRWIAVNGSDAELAAEATVESACPEEMKAFSSRYPVRGKVSLLQGSRARVDLETLTSSGGKAVEWRPYKFNGEYRLVRVGGSATQVATSDCFSSRAPETSCPESD